MKEQKCTACGVVNALEFSLRAGNTESVTVRCKNCKQLMKVDVAHA